MSAAREAAQAFLDAWNRNNSSDETVRAAARLANALQAIQGTAREVFLGMIADAHRYEAEYDGDETGGSMSYHLSTGSGFEDLAEALGVPPPGYMEGWPDAIDRAVAGAMDDARPAPQEPGQ